MYGFLLQLHIRPAFFPCFKKKILPYDAPLRSIYMNSRPSVSGGVQEGGRPTLLNKRTFFYQAALLALSNTVLLLLGFVYRVMLGRLAGAEGLGVYTLTIQVYAIVMSVCVAGLCVGVTHVSASLAARSDILGIRRLVRFAMFCFIALLGIMAVPIVLMRNQIASGILGDARTANALWMILICILLTGTENILKATFHGTRMVRFTAISELGEQVLRILLASLLLARFINGDHGHTAFLILSVMTLSELYSVVFLGASYFVKFRIPAQSKKKPAAGIRRSFLKIAVPSALTSMLSNVFASISVVIFPSRLMLSGYTRAEAVSSLGLISGMVMPVLLLPSALVGALCTLIMPSIAASISRGDHPDLIRKVNKGIEAAGLLGLPATAVLLPYIPMLCGLLFGQTVPPALADALSLQAITMYYLAISTSILNGIGKQKQVLILAAVGEALQLALVWVLTAVPRLHVYGYIIGMLSGDLLRVAAGFILLHKATHTRPRLFHAGVVPIACSVILYVSVRMIFFSALQHGMTAVGAMLVSMPVCTLLYFLLLRLLGVRIWPYFRKIVFRKDPAHPNGPEAEAV